LINAYQGWEEAKRRGNERQFCWDNFLAVSTLKMIANMKGQFARHLHDVGFLTSSNCSHQDANRYSTNWNLIKAVICAGLYPSVAKIEMREFQKRPPRISTEADGKVAIHPKSVNSEEKYFSSQWLIYHEKMKTNKIYLYDCTMISPFPLLFFGGDLLVTTDKGYDTIQVGSWIKFHAPRKTAELVKDLRKELDRLLEEKIRRPSMELVASRNSDTHECKILNAIIELIATEEIKTHRRLEHRDDNNDDDFSHYHKN